MTNHDPSDGFIREVTEEVRNERMSALARRYGPLVAAVVLLAVGAAAVWSWFEQQAQVAAAARGAALMEAPLDDPASAAGLVETIDGPAAVIARLRLARTQAEAGETEAAVETYRAIASDGSAQPAYADLAALMAARLEAQVRPAEEVILTLSPLADIDGPYRLLATELRAAIQLNAGATAEAHRDLRTILTDPAATEGLVARARELLIATGGALPAATN